MEDQVRNQKKERTKAAAKPSAKLIKVKPERDAFAVTGPTARLSARNSVQSVYSITGDTAFSVREILANCGHPIQEIFRKIIIPKLYAKEVKVITSRGKVETLVVDNHDIQLKTALELAKMCGCYTAAKSGGDTDSTDGTAQFDLSGASDDELIAIIKLVSNIKEKNSVCQSRILQAKPNDMAPRQ